MKKLFFTFVFFCFSFEIFAEISFSKRESSWDTGSLYEYRVTSEGNKGIDLFVYVKDDHTVAYFADQSEFVKQVFIYEDTYDPESGVVIESHGRNPLSYARENFSNIESHVKMNKTSSKARMWGSAWAFGKRISMDEELDLPAVPWTETSSFLSELWFMMRNLNHDTTSFDISVTNNGKASLSKVKLEGREKTSGIECDKWTVTGKKENHTLWFDRNDPSYRLYKYSSKGIAGFVKSPSVNFVNRTELSSSEWDDFCKDKTEEIRIKQKLPENK